MNRFQKMAVALCVLALPPSPGTALEQTYEIVVAPQTDTPLTESDSRKVLQIIVNRMSTACGTFRVQPGFEQLPASFTGAADASTHAKRKRYRDTGTSVQVVPSISRCPDPPDPGNIFGGCSPETGPVLVRHVPASDDRGRTRLAQKWAHEIGHAQGLIGNFAGYVSGHSTNSGSLMFPTANADRWGMSTSECSTYYLRQKFPPPQPGAATEVAEAEQGQELAPDVATDAPADDGMLVPEPDADMPSDAPDGDDILRGEWDGDLPIPEIEENRATLLERAERAIDENQVEFWPGSVVVVAYAGQQAAAERVVKVLTAHPDELGFELDEYQAFQFNDAKIRAAGALSYVVYRARTGDYEGEDAGLAFAALSDTLSPSRNLGLPFADDGRDIEALTQEVALNATSGLGLMAVVSDEAQSMLEDHRQANRAGAYDLGVDDTYFDDLNTKVSTDRRRSPAAMSLYDILTE